MSQETLLILAGIIVPIVVQAIKAGYKALAGSEMSSGLALNLTYAMAVLVAVIGKLLAGELLIPVGDAPAVAGAIITQLGVVIGLATVIYKALLSPSTGVLGRE